MEIATVVERMSAIDRAVDRTERSFSRIERSASGISAAFLAASRTIISAVSKINHSVLTLARNTALIGTAATAAVGREAINAYADFEFQLTRTASIAARNNKEYKKLRQSLRDIALELAGPSFKTPNEIAESMYTLASAGIKSADVLRDMTREIVTFAEAFDTSVPDAAELILSISRIYQREGESLGATAHRIARELAAGIQVSQATADRLAVALQYTSLPARQLGIDIHDLVAMIGLLIDSGLPASMVGTQLRMMLAKLIRPTQTAQNILAKYGLTIADIDIKSRGLLPVLKTLERAHLSNADVIALVGTEAQVAYNVLARNVNRFEDLSRAMLLTNSVARVQGRMMDTLSGQWQALKGDIQRAFIIIGENMAPAMRDIVDGFRQLITQFTKLPAIIQIGRALGNMILSIGHAILRLLSAAGAADSIAKILTMIAHAFSVVLNPKNLEHYAEAISHLIAFIRQNGQAVVRFLENLNSGEFIEIAVHNLVAELSKIWGPILDGLFAAIQAAAPRIANLMWNIISTSIFALIESIFGKKAAEEFYKLVNSIIETLQDLGPVIADIVKDIAKILKLVIPLVVRIIGSLVKVASLFRYVIAEALILIGFAKFNLMMLRFTLGIRKAVGEIRLFAKLFWDAIFLPIRILGRFLGIRGPAGGNQYVSNIKYLGLLLRNLWNAVMVVARWISLRIVPIITKALPAIVKIAGIASVILTIIAAIWSVGRDIYEIIKTWQPAREAVKTAKDTAEMMGMTWEEIPATPTWMERFIGWITPGTTGLDIARARWLNEQPVTGAQLSRARQYVMNVNLYGYSGDDVEDKVKSGISRALAGAY